MRPQLMCFDAKGLRLAVVEYIEPGPFNSIDAMSFLMELLS